MYFSFLIHYDPALLTFESHHKFLPNLTHNSLNLVLAPTRVLSSKSRDIRNDINKFMPSEIISNHKTLKSTSRMATSSFDSSSYIFRQKSCSKFPDICLFF